jgi:hypothetical protein
MGHRLNDITEGEAAEITSPKPLWDGTHLTNAGQCSMIIMQDEMVV